MAVPGSAAWKKLLMATRNIDRHSGFFRLCTGNELVAQHPSIVICEVIKLKGCFLFCDISNREHLYQLLYLSWNESGVYCINSI
jgi:hypothetical protein